MIEKFLREYISIVAGSGADKILAILFNKKNVNEFLIAKKLNMTINQTRNILYKLADGGLVHFMRKKDLKSGGWYTYFWTLNENKCLVNYKASILKEIEEMKNLLEVQKTKQFYKCNTCGAEVSDEQALLNEFTCTECGEVYSLKDSADSIKDIEKSIQRIHVKSFQIQEEIDKLSVSRAPKAPKKIKNDKTKVKQKKKIQVVKKSKVKQKKRKKK